jgi:hypothetical protein
MISNSQKQQVIFYINEIEDKFKFSKNYFKELTQIRNRYIFMEVSNDDFNKDVEFLKRLKDIIWFWNL